MNVYRTYITSSTIMITTTKRNKSKFRKVSGGAAIIAAAGKYKPDNSLIMFCTEFPFKINHLHYQRQCVQNDQMHYAVVRRR